jgi:hypothetical protein
VAATRSGSSRLNSKLGERAELDSHANMICLGRHCSVIRRTGVTMKGKAFVSEVGSLDNIPVVDAVIVYDCPFTGESYFLLMYNCFDIPSMECHLIPPSSFVKLGYLSMIHRRFSRWKLTRILMSSMTVSQRCKFIWDSLGYSVISNAGPSSG